MELIHGHPCTFEEKPQNPRYTKLTLSCTAADHHIHLQETAEDVPAAKQLLVDKMRGLLDDYRRVVDLWFILPIIGDIHEALSEWLAPARADHLAECVRRIDHALGDVDAQTEEMLDETPGAEVTWFRQHHLLGLRIKVTDG